MVNRNILFKMAWVLILFVLSTKLVAEISSAELSNLLSEKDRLSQIGYRISFVITTQDNQFKDPNQGMVIKECNATWKEKDVFVMKIIYQYEHLPIFATPKLGNYQPSDYDDKGNLIVWRTMEEYILSASDRNDTIQKVKVFFVDPDGQILKTGDNILSYRYPINKPYSSHQFKYYQLPMGRGFSKHLGSVTSVKSQTLNLMKVTSKGSCGPPIGTWELTLDPNSDYLVRKAFFMMDGERDPTIAITTDGVVMKDGMKFAKYGSIKYQGLLDLSIEVTDISKIVGKNELYEEVYSRLNEALPKGAVVIDMRGDQPIRTTVE